MKKRIQLMRKMVAFLTAAILVLPCFAFASGSEEPRPDIVTGYYGATDDAIIFGHYEQDNDLTNGSEPIEWILLDTESDGTLVLISKYSLDVKPYNIDRTDVTWETCTLRMWLNGDFYTEAFSEDEQRQILATHVINENNPSTGTICGNDTDDKVYLLSVNEVTGNYSTDFWYTYFADDSTRMCLPTRYTISQGVGRPGLYMSNKLESGYWWLRSSGVEASYAACVDYKGIPSGFGTYVDDMVLGIRPVIRVSGTCFSTNPE